MAKNDPNVSADGQYEERLIQVRRTAKVVKGGRIFRFSAISVVGNGCGRFGYGSGTAREVPEAIRKAMESARRNLIEIELNDSTIHHTIIAQHGATKVLLKPAPEGAGIIAGAPMRAVFEVAGIQNITGKCYGSTNPINVVRATISGLLSSDSPHSIAEKRGKSVEDIMETVNA
jgi:small subunit ribosomal protein S5